MTIDHEVKVDTRLKFVYAHSVDGKIFYVGSGELSRAFEKTSRNKVWKSMVAAYGRYEVSLIFETQDAQEALEFEYRKILEIRPVANLAIPKLRQNDALTAGPAGEPSEAV